MAEFPRREIIDDRGKGKRVRYMEAVGFMYKDLPHKVIQGYLYLISLLMVGPVLISFGVKLYMKKELFLKLGLKFQKMIETAVSFIRSFKAPRSLEVPILFNSFYLCLVVSCELTRWE